MRFVLCAFIFISGCSSLFGEATVFNSEATEDSGVMIEDEDTGTPCQEQMWYLDADADGYGDSNVMVEACEVPEGYVSDATDCDDTNAMVYPGASELCNNIDDNCDGEVDNDPDGDDIWYVDADGDGYGNPDMAQECDGYDWFVSQAGDCDDLNADVNPDATEVCDDIDNDCDDTIDEDNATDATPWYRDSDSDGYGDNAVVRNACVQPEGYVSDNTDCDDVYNNVNPGAVEYCDTLDNDCDSEVDEDVTSTYYLDMDGDGYGNPVGSFEACVLTTGMVEDNTDCDDDHATVNPGASEICDELDNNCDGEVDEGVKTIFYTDADSDTYGDPTVMIESCGVLEGYVSDSTDCNDFLASIFPGASESCNDLDDDCDGVTDENDALDASTWYRDNDSDTYGDSVISLKSCEEPAGYVSDATDCDDTNAMVNPGASEICDTLDNDCDGMVDENGAVDAPIWYIDTDGDGYGDSSLDADLSACTEPAGYADNNTDCDDLNHAIHPSATEFCDEIDNDCDGLVDEERGNLFYADADGDGYGNPAISAEACSVSTGYVDDATDCDDTASSTHPGTSEMCNSVDDDCDGTIDNDATDMSAWYLDYDGDSFGNSLAQTWACTQSAGYVADATDCDDLLSSVSPSATEICNGLDDNCDGEIDEGVKTTFFADTDGDTYGNAATTAEACSTPTGYVANSTDCDDTNAAVNPGAFEYCDNDIDDNCDSAIDDARSIDVKTWWRDADSDGYGDNGSPSTVPALACEAPEGYVADHTDCDDANDFINPEGIEICDDGNDNDCDGTIDLEDECLYEGLYEGTFMADVEIATFGITDTCEGTVTLDVAVDGVPMIYGEGSCAFSGILAGYYGDDILGTIEGDFLPDLTAEGVLYDDDMIFDSEWVGLFDEDSFDAFFTGEGTLLGYAYTYDGSFEGINTP